MSLPLAGMINKKRAKVQFELKTAHGDSQTRTWLYAVDWDTMEQVNLSTGARRPVERVILNQATKIGDDADVCIEFC